MPVNMMKMAFLWKGEKEYGVDEGICVSEDV